ncbi:hypothetical protein Bpfe_006431, partial [Biomphalaria pfeifferi]
MNLNPGVLSLHISLTSCVYQRLDCDGLASEDMSLVLSLWKSSRSALRLPSPSPACCEL